MRNFWWNDYIGIPFSEGGDTRQGCDCWGLVRLVNREVFGKELIHPRGEFGSRREVGEIMHLTKELCWEPVSDPKTGDVALFRVGGYDSHVGIVTSPGMMLHVREGRDATAEPYTSRQWKHALRGLYRYAGERNLEVLAPDNGIRVVGCPNPLSFERVDLLLQPGMTLGEIIRKVCDGNNIPEEGRKHGHAYIDSVYYPQSAWENVLPNDGQVVTFRIYPRGGGMRGFFGIAIMIAAAVVSVYTGGVLAGPSFELAAGLAGALGGLAGAAVSIAGTLVMNALFPMPTPKAFKMGQVGEQLHFLSGSRNSLRPYKSVPQVLGIGRMTLDYLGKPYTSRSDQYTQYLIAAYTAGYGPVEISDIRNGDTPLTKYQDMEHVIYSGYADDPGAKIYTKNVSETEHNITMQREDNPFISDWYYFTTPVDTDQVTMEFYFPKGAWCQSQNSGKYYDANVEILIEGKQLPSGTYKDMAAFIAPSDFRLQSCSPLLNLEQVYDDAGELEENIWWLQTYGVPKNRVAKNISLDLWQWHVFSLDKNNRIIKRTGNVTDSKNKEASERLLKLISEGKYQWNKDSFPGRLPPIGENEELLYHVCVHGDAIVEVQDKRDSVSVSGVNASFSRLTLSLSEGEVIRGVAGKLGVYYSKQMDPFTRTYTFDVPRGQHEFRVRRDGKNYQGDPRPRHNTCIWRVTRCRTNGKPFKQNFPLSRVEMQVRATNQLNGSLDSINAAVASIVNDYDYKAKSWKPRKSGNPASLFRHVLQGPGIANPIPDSQLDIVTLERWHNFCRVQGFSYFNIIGADESASVYDVLSGICAAGRATPEFKDGKWTVIIDEPRTTVVQHFTPHNSWGFSGTRVLTEVPHAIRANFINKTKGFEQDCITVYADGYGPSNASKFEEWSLDRLEGITDPDHVRFAVRFAMAWAILRPENYRLFCDIEHIVCSRGDLVRVSNDTALWGLGSGRIKSLVKEGTEVKGLVLEEPVQMEPHVEYTLRIRLSAKKGKTRKFTLIPVDKEGFYDTAYFDPTTEDIPLPGDLYQFGQLDRESRECLVEFIRPSADGSAEIGLIDYSPEIYTVDDGPLPEWDSGITLPPDIAREIISAVPGLESAYSDERAIVMLPGGALQCRIGVAYSVPKDVEDSVTHVQARFRLSAGVDPDGEPHEAGGWATMEAIPVTNGVLFISPVEESSLYDVELRFVSSDGLSGNWNRVLDEHKVLGKLADPPDVEELILSIDSPTGIKAEWSAVDVIDLSHYLVTGSLQAETIANYVTIPAPKKTGVLTLHVVAVDTGGRKSKNSATAGIRVDPPSTPSASGVVREDGLSLVWQDCARTWPIRHYIVEDLHTGKVERVDAESMPVTPRPQGKYTFRITAVDVFDNASSRGSSTVTVGELGQPQPIITIDGADMVISWPPVSSPFGIAFYRIVTEDFELIGEAKTTYYRMPCPPTGTHEFRVAAIDVFGNESAYGEASFVVGPPRNPRVFAKVEEDGILVSWTSPDGLLPLLNWDVERVHVINPGTAEEVVETESYGTLDVTQVHVPAVKKGTHTFKVRSRDSAGNVSGWGSVDFVAKAPGRVTVDGTVVDNNVLMYWTVPNSIFFPIREYIFSKVEGGKVMEVGRVDALFFSTFETKSGTYTYRITPVDVAGNLGTAVNYAATVAQPPDFIFYHDADSAFGGTKTNFVLDRQGGMVGPVPVSETWEQNITRSGKTTWKAKSDAGYVSWLEPRLTQGSYMEIVDTNLDVPMSRIVITPTYETISGTPVLTCKIETSLNKTSWKTLTTNGWNVMGAAFRYVRYTIGVSGGAINMTNINCRLDVKKISDFGNVYCAANDNAPGFVDMNTTPMLTGTYVPFNISFTDVESIPKPNVRNNPDYTAFTVFVDEPYPAGFRIFVLDKNGRRVSATVDWAAYGV